MPVYKARHHGLTLVRYVEIAYYRRVQDLLGFHASNRDRPDAPFLEQRARRPESNFDQVGLELLVLGLDGHSSPEVP